MSRRDPTAPLLIDSRYLVESEIGRGGMGIVYRARDVGLDRLVAIKLLKISAAREDPHSIKAFQREARLLAAIRHPNVAAVHAFGRHDDGYFFAMEFVDGASLEMIILEHGMRKSTVPIHRATTILKLIAGGLAAAHAAGVVHHDIKPGNVVIENDSGRPVLIDFGLATMGPDQEGDMYGGTAEYLAPEELNRPLDRSMWSPRTDVYSFGCMMFELFTGKPPFADAVGVAELLRMHREAPIPALAAGRPELLPFEAVVRKAMAKDRTERYPSALALAAAIDAATAEWKIATERRDTASPAPAGNEPTASDYWPLTMGCVRALVVDDDPDFLRFATRAVQLAFFGAKVEISMASTGARAIESAERAPPHLVLLDFDMPGLDGLATLSRLRGLPHGEAMRVIVISGRAPDEARWKFSVLGVRNFLHKPVQLPDLVARIQEIAQRSGWLEGETSAEA
ncbi:MAG: protein kinase domain-containing protein [Polyangiaceae bacterium]